MQIVAAGDCGIDRYMNVKADRVGGITMNFAVNARQHFRPTDSITVVTALGQDEGAELVVGALAQFDITAAYERSPGATPVQFIDRHPNGEKIFTRYEAGVLAEHKLSAKQKHAINRCDLLVVPFYTQIAQFYADVLATPSYGLRVVDFGALRTAQCDPISTVRQSIEALDVAVFGLQASEHSLLERLEQLVNQHDKLFVVTLGAAGSIGLRGGKRVYCAATRVEHIRDTTGAGDTFLAAFLAHHCYGASLPESLRAGADAASRTIARVGAFDSPVVAWPKLE